MRGLTDAAFVLRGRTGWEAADSGVLLWRAACPALLLFFSVPLAILILILALIPQVVPTWTFCVILWYLKPLFDRFALHVAAKRFFDRDVGTFRLLKGLGASLWRGLVGDLLWRRFSLWRGAVMPVRVLENPARAAVRRRVNVLERGKLNFCAFVSIACLILQHVVYAGILIFAFSIGNLFDLNAADFMGGIFNRELWNWIAYALSYVLVESLYVCMGFAIYINSRVEVEGWDLQLSFAALTKPLIVLLLLFSPLLSPLLAPLHAQEIPADNIPMQELRQVLDSDALFVQKESHGVRLKERAPRKSRQWTFPDWMHSLKSLGAQGLRALVAAAIIVLAFFVVRYLRRYGLPRRRTKQGEAVYRPPPAPTDAETLLTEADAAYHAGRMRDAWAHCFAAALCAYRDTHQINFPQDATEYECLHLVRQAASESAEGFAALVAAWVRLAYAGEMPDTHRFESARAWCRTLYAAK
jgi:hypothetical protein